MNFGVPAHVDYASNSALVFDHHCRVVFDGIVMHNVRELSFYTGRFAKQIIEYIDAMGSNVEERTAPSFGAIEEPTAVAAAIEPHMVRQFGNHRPSDYTLFNQLLCALNLGI